MEEREAIVSQIELANEMMEQSGTKNDWFKSCDELTWGVSKESNGFLFEELAEAAGHSDASAVELLREGAMCVLGVATWCICSCRREDHWPVGMQRTGVAS